MPFSRVPMLELAHDGSIRCCMHIQSATHLCCKPGSKASYQDFCCIKPAQGECQRDDQCKLDRDLNEPSSLPSQGFPIPALDLHTPYAQLSVIHLRLILCQLFVAHFARPVGPGGALLDGARSLLSLHQASFTDDTCFTSALYDPGSLG